jgi:uncharacterized protein YndB with AHSA1/START domain
MAEDAQATRGAASYVEPDPVAAVHVARTFPAPREQVFRAWTESDAVCQWFGGPLGSTESVEADVRVGGSYRITFKVPPTKRTVYLVGSFLEVEPPERLVYTFAWEKLPIPVFGMGDSKVTVQFREQGNGTEVSLTHELLDKRRLIAFHRFGWNSSLERLGKFLARQQS